MGVRDLITLLKNQNIGIESKPIEKIGKGYILIDTSITIYQAVNAIRKTGKDLTDKKGQISSHIYVIIYRIIRLLKNGIIPIFIFDSSSIDEKKHTLEKRKKMKEQRESFYITEDIKKSSIKIINLLGLPYILSPDEADPICAYLAKKYPKKIIGVATEDSDILVYGAPTIIKNFFSKENLVVNYKNVIKNLNISSKQFIDLAILLGNDYIDRIKGIGPKKSLSYIQEYGKIENIIPNIPKTYKKNIPENYLNQVKTTRNLYKNYDRYSDKIDTNDLFKWKEPNYKKLKNYLKEEYNFENTRIEKIINNISNIKSPSKN